MTMASPDCCSDCILESDSEKITRWRIDTISVLRCLLVLAVLTTPSCCALEDTAGISANSPTKFTWAEVNLTYKDPTTNKDVSESAQGKYGSNGLVEQRKGLAVLVRNKENKTHGCDEYDQKLKLPKEKWIAVVERGHCYFTEKIKMATKKYNASAVIIYNNEGKKEITIMQHTGKLFQYLFHAFNNVLCLNFD